MRKGLMLGIAALIIIALLAVGVLKLYLSTQQPQTTQTTATTTTTSTTTRSSTTSPTTTQESNGGITVVDALGRKVTLPHVAQRVVVTDDEVAELVQLLGAADKVVGIEPSIKTRGYFPLMADKPVTGSQFRGLNYELLMKLKPDVVIMMDVGPVGKIIDKLNKIGIKCVVISIDPAKIPQTLKILGKILGKEERAEAALKWWNQKWAELEQRLAPLKGKPKLKVFVGMGFAPSKKLPLHTWGQLAKWNYILDRLNMVNIAASKLRAHGEVDEEFVAEENPDIIIIGDWSDNWVGYTKNTTALAQAMIQNVLNDPALKDVNAVKEHHVYVMHYVMLGSFRSVIGAYYLAKAAYPNLMKGIDPDQIQKEYFEKWLGVPYKGIWFYPEPWKSSSTGGQA